MTEEKIKRKVIKIKLNGKRRKGGKRITIDGKYNKEWKIKAVMLLILFIHILYYI